MAKPCVVYPVSADLSALLGAAADVDAAWVYLPTSAPASMVALEERKRVRLDEARRRFAQRARELGLR